MRRFVYYGASSAGASLLLDLYPAPVAYSLRKLRTAYLGSAIRVRRSSDNAELDIGFVSENLDTTTLLTFVGGGSGFVTKWYNQGSVGSIADCFSTTASNQFQIVLSGTLQETNNKPSAKSATHIPYTIPSFRLDGVKTVFGVNKINTYSIANYLFYNEAGGQIGGMFQAGTLASISGIGAFDGAAVRTITGEDLIQQLSYVNLRSGDMYASKNGQTEVNAGSFTSSLSLRFVFGRSNSGASFFGSAQELIFYTTDESANKTAIETNINNYYGIY